MKILVTGAAGFIGCETSRKLLQRGDEVLGIDSLNDYYSVQLKQDRLSTLRDLPSFAFEHLDVCDLPALRDKVSAFSPDRIVHLAAQAGVRYSLENPHAYIQSNIVGFMNILELARECQVEHLVYASSSSVYGANTTLPFSTVHSVDHPVSMYAATKKSNELMAHCYSSLYGLPTTGLRFFTVYGPWGRPDMAAFLFTEKILAGEPIPVFNHGNHRRDFTYIDDIVEGVIRVTDTPAKPDPDYDPSTPHPGRSNVPYRVYNIGNSSPVLLTDFIDAIETALGKKAIQELQPMAKGDVVDTFADVSDLVDHFDYRPGTTIQEGINRFVQWYRGYYSQ